MGFLLVTVKVLNSYNCWNDDCMTEQSSVMQNWLPL